MSERNNVVLKVIATILSGIIIATIIANQVEIAVLKTEKINIIQRLDSIDKKIDAILDNQNKSLYNRRDRGR